MLEELRGRRSFDGQGAGRRVSTEAVVVLYARQWLAIARTPRFWFLPLKFLHDRLFTFVALGGAISAVVGRDLGPAGLVRSGGGPVVATMDSDSRSQGLVSMESGNYNVDRDYGAEEEVTEYVAPMARYNEEFAQMKLELERAAARAKTTTQAIVEQLHASAPPEAEWIEYFTEQGRPYYYNEQSGESRWQCPVPEQMGLTMDLAAQLHSGDLLDLELVAAGVEGSLRRRGRDDDDEESEEGGRVGFADEGSFDGSLRSAQSAGSSLKSWTPSMRLTPGLLAERERMMEGAGDMASRTSATRQARDQVLIDEAKEAELGLQEAQDARIALIAREFWAGVRDESIKLRINNWIVRRREDHEREMREMHKYQKAEYRMNKGERKVETFATMLAAAAEEDETVDDVSLCDDGSVDFEAEREKRARRRGRQRVPFRYRLVSARVWTSDHLSERSRSVKCFFLERARAEDPRRIPPRCNARATRSWRRWPRRSGWRRRGAWRSSRSATSTRTSTGTPWS